MYSGRTVSGLSVHVVFSVVWTLGWICCVEVVFTQPTLLVSLCCHIIVYPEYVFFAVLVLLCLVVVLVDASVNISALDPPKAYICQYCLVHLGDIGELWLLACVLSMCFCVLLVFWLLDSLTLPHAMHSGQSILFCICFSMLCCSSVF